MDGNFIPKPEKESLKRRVQRLLLKHFYPDILTDPDNKYLATEFSKVLISLLSLGPGETIAARFVGKEYRLAFIDKDRSEKCSATPIVIPRDPEKLLKHLDEILSPSTAAETVDNKKVPGIFSFLKILKEADYHGEVAEQFEILSRQAASGLIKEEDLLERRGFLQKRMKELVLRDVHNADQKTITGLINSVMDYYANTWLAPNDFADVQTELNAKIASLSGNSY